MGVHAWIKAPLLLLWGLALLQELPIVYAGNHTIDDTDPSITYSPGWNAGNATGTCALCVSFMLHRCMADVVSGYSCLAHPNPALAYQETWHDTTRGNGSSAPPLYFQYTFAGAFLTSPLYLF